MTSKMALQEAAKPVLAILMPLLQQYCPFVITFFEQLLSYYKKYPDVISVVIAVVVVAFLKNLPILLYKTNFTVKSLIFMVLSRDASGISKQKNPPMELPKNVRVVREKYVVFIRHGESEWNLIFNKKPRILLPIRLVIALVVEFLMKLCTRDSLFYDSPLNEEGMEQACELEAAIQMQPSQTRDKILNDSVYVTSNLRRAITTLLMSFKNHFSKGMPAVRMWGCLQEISRNVDTQSEEGLTPKDMKPEPSASLKRRDPIVANMYYQINVSDYNGNKGLSYRGLDRLQEFCDKSFDLLDQERKTTIVVGGHSLWFKNFFKIFLPAEPHTEALATIATKNKIANGGMVRFILQKLQDEKGATSYRIRPESIQELHLGFDSKKMK